MTTLENTIETLTRELNEKKQVLQHEMNSFENQNKVYSKNNKKYIIVFNLSFSIEILVERETQQHELERTLNQMTKLINQHENTARVNSSICIYK